MARAQALKWAISWCQEFVVLSQTSAKIVAKYVHVKTPLQLYLSCNGSPGCDCHVFGIFFTSAHWEKPRTVTAVISQALP